MRESKLRVQMVFFLNRFSYQFQWIQAQKSKYNYGSLQLFTNLHWPLHKATYRLRTTITSIVQSLEESQLKFN